MELIGVIAELREKCDWKSAQTHRSLQRYLLEETYETLDAIDSGDPAALREELGDLLLQVYFHAAIATEAGEYDIDDVAGDLVEKMVRRNPHVFGEATASGSAEVNDLWQAVKAAEKPRTSVTDGLPPALPALLYADKVLDRLARAGRPAVIDPESADLGERLLALVAEARAEDLDPEQALRDAVARRLPAVVEQPDVPAGEGVAGGSA